MALQIKHQGLLILGDHLQGRPVIESKGHNDFYDQASISGFERALQFTEQERTMLRISYRFGEQIADGVGIFGGYGGLASGVTFESAFYKEFERFWTSNENPYKQNLVLPPAEARHHRAMREGHESYHRLDLNVADGHSSLPAKGNSTVNFANVDAGITFLMHLVASCSAMVTGNDIMIGTPFVSQAEIWRQQLSIRWPESGIEVLTVSYTQQSYGTISRRTSLDMFISALAFAYLKPMFILTNRAAFHKGKKDGLWLLISLLQTRPKGHLLAFWQSGTGQMF